MVQIVTLPLRQSYTSRNLMQLCSFCTFTQPLLIRATPYLEASPVKKKKKMDPALVRLRTEKKAKRLWRDCLRLMKLEKQLKPIDEIEPAYHLIDEKQKYTRTKVALTIETLEARADLLKEWTHYRSKQHLQDLKLIDRIDYAQYRSLQKLLALSPTLYNKAIQLDETFLPVKFKAPTITPPIEGYDNPDGEYHDVTKKWDPVKIPELEKKTSTFKK